MRQRRTLSLLLVIVAVLLMSIGYAAIQDVTFNVTGSASATPDQSNFKVAFTGTPTYTGTGTPTLKIIDDTTATISVTDLEAVGDTVTANFTIANTSSDITAYLSSSFTNSNTEYFEVTAALDDTELEPVNGTTTLRVTVKLIKAPVSASQTANITVETIASPTAPAKIISFTIDGTTYYAEEGMTWVEWVNTEYNTVGAYTSYGYWVSCVKNSTMWYLILSDGMDVDISDKIMSNLEYVFKDSGEPV